MAEQQFWEKKLLGLEGAKQQGENSRAETAKDKISVTGLWNTEGTREENNQKEGLNYFALTSSLLLKFARLFLDDRVLISLGMIFSSTYKKILRKNGNANGQEKEKSELKKKTKKKSRPYQ